MTQKIKPFECKSLADTKKLEINGVKSNNNSITLNPNVVVLTLGNTTIKVPQELFEKFARWYLECKSLADTKKLEINCVKSNNNSITLESNVVFLTFENTTIKVPQKLFEKFARWYLEG